MTNDVASHYATDGLLGFRATVQTSFLEDRLGIPFEEGDHRGDHERRLASLVHRRHVFVAGR